MSACIPPLGSLITSIAARAFCMVIPTRLPAEYGSDMSFGSDHPSARASALATLSTIVISLVWEDMGYRGQTIAPLNWNQYGESAEYGRIMTVKARKNDEVYWLPCDRRLVAHLDAIARTSTTICTTSQGVPWKNEQALQGAVSKFLRGLQADGVTGPGLTLHGLRVTFAAALKRDHGASDKDVATALGDRSERMGGHYTRHVEKEATIIRLFSKAAP